MANAQTKAELELEKLDLEIAELKRAWWQKPAYIAAAFPTLLALASLVYAFANGYFQASAVKLENEKHDLQAQKAQLIDDLKKLSDEKAQLEARKEALIQRIKDVESLIEGQPSTLAQEKAPSKPYKKPSVAEMDPATFEKYENLIEDIRKVENRTKPTPTPVLSAELPSWMNPHPKPSPMK